VAMLMLSGAAAATSSAPAIAFVRETKTGPPQVWVEAANGSGARRLASGQEQPLISPNGAWVASSYAAIGAAKGPLLELLATSGSTKHGFFTTTKFVPAPLAWSSDSRYLLVGLTSTALKGQAGAGLAVIDTQTMTATTLASGVVSGASFAPNSSDRIVYATSAKYPFGSPVNLHEVNPDGSDPAQITTDGDSLNPVWGAKGIVFDRVHVRPGVSSAPAYQVWLMNGSHLTQLTHMKVPQLLDGLVPLAVSASGNRVIAEYGGEDTSQGYTIQISPLKVRQLTEGTAYIQGWGISRDGSHVLVSVGGFEQPANHGTIESLPFAGGPPVTKLGKGDEPSWNQ
jgi:hypothetical protein